MLVRLKHRVLGPQLWGQGLGGGESPPPNPDVELPAESGKLWAETKKTPSQIRDNCALGKKEEGPAGRIPSVSSSPEQL